MPPPETDIVAGRGPHPTGLGLGAMRRRPTSRGAGATVAPARGVGGKVLRYAAGSGVATACSQGTFLVLYGPLGRGPALSSTLAWAAGAAPNYWLNRTWTWGRQGRPSLVRELLPYIAIVTVTLALATLATSAADRALGGADASDGARLVLVGATFLGVYGVMFLLRFFLLDRLFRPDPVGRPLATTDRVPVDDPT